MLKAIQTLGKLIDWLEKLELEGPDKINQKALADGLAELVKGVEAHQGMDPEELRKALATTFSSTLVGIVHGWLDGPSYTPDMTKWELWQGKTKEELAELEVVKVAGEMLECVFGSMAHHRLLPLGMSLPWKGREEPYEWLAQIASDLIKGKADEEAKKEDEKKIEKGEDS